MQDDTDGSLYAYVNDPERSPEGGAAPVVRVTIEDSQLARRVRTAEDRRPHPNGYTRCCGMPASRFSTVAAVEAHELSCAEMGVDW